MRVSTALELAVATRPVAKLSSPRPLQMLAHIRCGPRGARPNLGHRPGDTRTTGWRSSSEHCMRSVRDRESRGLGGGRRRAAHELLSPQLLVQQQLASGHCIMEPCADWLKKWHFSRAAAAAAASRGPRLVDEPVPQTVAIGTSCYSGCNFSMQRVVFPCDVACDSVRGESVNNSTGRENESVSTGGACKWMCDWRVGESHGAWRRSTKSNSELWVWSVPALGRSLGASFVLV